MSLVRTETTLGAFDRRGAYRIGTPKAITATARKLATQYRLRVLRHLRRRAATLGFSLVSREPGELLEGTVS
jgi:hypothetical protein